MTEEKYSGFLFNIDERKRAYLLNEDLRSPYTSSKNVFSDTISAPDWSVKKYEIFLIPSNDNWNPEEARINCIALVKRGAKVATLKYRINFTDILKFNPSISFKSIEEGLGSKFSNYFIDSSIGEGKRVPPKTWEKLVTIIKESSEENKKIFNHIENLMNIKPTISEHEHFSIMAEEKDAVNLALRASNLSKTPVKKFKLCSDKSIPFLNGLDEFAISEDTMITTDSQVFGNLNIFKRNITGAVQFTENTEKQPCLTIWNVNRTPIEQTLGVDLIYYNHSFNAYTMVQYKRMLDESGIFVYRPNGNSYKKEFQNMKALFQMYKGGPIPKKLKDYRFSDEFLFFKFCNAIQFEFDSAGMIDGLYLPLSYWELFIESDKSVGKNGGRLVTEYNIGKSIKNGFFIDLVSSGWVGSKSLNSDKITLLIKKLLRKKHSIMLAHYKEEPYDTNTIFD